jgi:ubiquinone/menaquinone biosynthesis C-methylase UbiE
MAVEYKKFSSGPGTQAIKVMIERTNAILPFSRATAILDNGCGPGPITSAVIKQYGAEIPADCEFLAADFSEGMVKQVEGSKKEALESTGGDENASVWSRVQTQVLDATNLQGVADGSKSHVLAGWVYFMTPDPKACLTESLRVLQDGGVLACTAWEASDWLDVMMTLKEVRPDFTMPELPKNWSDAELLKKELEGAGFRDVKSERVPVTMGFETHEGLINFMADAMPMMTAFTKLMTAEEVQKFKDVAVAKMKEFEPNAPGTLHGWALLAVGQK